MAELEYLARLMPDATAWTCKHLALLVVTSSAGIIIFLATHSLDLCELLVLAAGVCFAYGLGRVASLPLLLIPYGSACVTGDASLGALLLPTACQLAFAETFSRHYVYLQTASPVSPKIARETRERVCLLRFYFAVCALIILAVGLSQLAPAERREQYHTVNMMWHSFAPKLALIYLIIPPYDKLGAFFRALREWFQYNSQELDEPGVFRSPCGPASRRIIPIYLLAFLLAAPLAQAVAGALATTIGQIDATDHALLMMLFFLGNWWQWLRPVLTLLCTTFLLTAPVLVHARRVAQAAGGSEFESYLERLDLMDARAR